MLGKATERTSYSVAADVTVILLESPYTYLTMLVFFFTSAFFIAVYSREVPPYTIYCHESTLYSPS